ncbi:serine hydroxymethyltransferase [candidate division Kazan bacterium RIFCSPLOWO2_01_FULL_48_13]|uniref:Serine hydroxymethyltransferase n=1 Tax=candidate division Kazan bacterium RIFCSPLOWO2_01_FULL_48_13 TaxID=1798539 RepID=A0A1F4PPL7_UNCK3|nr:MAG: serine hydroxymethyltransferase [candidate division Kazan bacterium RIFCSPLOWO2_01_FULL_48_13]
MSIKELIKKEEKRQQDNLSLIASENHTSKAVREAVGSVLMNKYAEGYPGKRYYGGNQIIDQVELEAISSAKKIFKAEHANVQPYSGTPANLAIYAGLIALGDTVMGMDLSHGGHLSHGHKVSLSGKSYKFVQYGVNPETGLLDYEEIRRMARIFKPKLIVCGATAYPREIDFKRFAEIAHEVGAYCLADISHIAGLVVGGVHQSPVPYCDVVMTTTHKTLRGPRGAIILCKKELADKIDKAVFPGIQGGPHENVIAGKAICFEEAAKPAFRTYAKQIVKNSQRLADTLQQLGITICSGGTDTHLILVDLSSIGVTGKEAETALEKVGIVVNKNMIPGDTRSPFDPSGIRLGVPAVTTRGMKELEMFKLAGLINRVVREPGSRVVLESVKREVATLCRKFPVPK